MQNYNTKYKMGEDPSSDMKYKIMHYSFELIKEQGYNNVTIQQICKKLGITKSTFYYHFKSKDNLLEEYTRQIGSLAEKDFPRILMQDTFVKQLWEMLRIYFINNIEAGPKIINQVFISQLAAVQERDFPQSTRLFEMATNIIQKAKDANEITNQDSAENISAAIYFSTRGICVTWSMEDGSFDLIEKCKAVVNTILMPCEGFML